MKRPEHSLYVNGPEFPVHIKKLPKQRTPICWASVAAGSAMLILAGLAVAGGVYIYRDVVQRRAIIRHNKPSRYEVGDHLFHGKVPVEVLSVDDRWSGGTAGMQIHYTYRCWSEQFGEYVTDEWHLKRP